ncbi:MAG: site-specific integrase, partial [Lancefieldella rimae]
MSQTSDNSPANSYVDEFIAYLRTVRNLSDNTTRAYSVDLASYISWCKREELDPLQATHRSLRAYLSYLDQARYSARTLNRHLSALRGFYKWLNKEKYLEVDPSLILTSPRTSRRLPQTMSDEDVQKLLLSCDTDTAAGLRDRAILECMYATGARISEISHLDREDVDISQGVVRLFGKGSKERDVPLYKTARDWLEAYMYGA